VKTLLPFLIFVIVVVGLIVFSTRAKRKQANVQAERAQQISIGTEVMTTSGLYGTVVVRNDDETVQLSIAPGVEVKWALAALRDMESLPAQYRGDREPDDDLDQPPRSRVDLDKPRLTDTGGADPNS
jgi:preprotein translocase subunit YajC